ncbi:MAG: sodium-dependent transporter [Thermoguttaceae bacterium]|nr:sodium-dependent transporter [Thermoguttaceae bacterium]MDW8078682.1 sodium-dependent transporter [Thermoguttaceae bacterium]
MSTSSVITQPRTRAVKETWGTRIGVIMAVTGSAVGLGNFLRFPGLAAKYDGGAFMVPYLIALVLLGLPIAWVEWSMGRYGGSRGFNSAAGIYRAIWPSPVSTAAGVLAMLVPVVIYMYYVYVESWCLAYAIRYLLGGMNFGLDPSRYEAFFAEFVGLTENGLAFRAVDGWWIGSAAFFLLLCFLLNFYLIYRGLQKGIEWFCTWAMPTLVICALIILVRVLTLGTPDPSKPEQNILNGLGFMWNPATKSKSFWEALANPQMWLEAAGQIFFSLSVGFGIIVTYASYLKRDDDIALSSVTSAAGNEFCEVALGGLITIPAAFVFLGPQVIENPKGTFELGFVTLPNVFNHMVFGWLFGFLFFFLLFLAAVTSSLSMLQPAIALLEEGLGLGRRASVAILSFVTAVGSLFVVYFSQGLVVMDTFDFWVGNVGLYILATFQVILFAWVLGVDRGFEELQRGAEIKIPNFFKFVIKYISPLYLLAVFGAWCYQEFWANPQTLTKIIREPAAQAAVLFLLLVAAFFTLIVNQSVRRWERMKKLQQEVAP